MVLEDSPNGIRAAFAAGMTPVMVPDLVEPDEEMRKKAFCIAESLFDVPQIICELNK